MHCRVDLMQRNTHHSMARDSSPLVGTTVCLVCSWQGTPGGYVYPIQTRDDTRIPTKIHATDSHQPERMVPHWVATRSWATSQPVQTNLDNEWHGRSSHFKFLLEEQRVSSHFRFFADKTIFLELGAIWQRSARFPVFVFFLLDRCGLSW